MAHRGVNKVIIVGNLGQDPETRYSANGTAFTSMSVATSEVWKDQNGQQQERTEWHRISLIGKIAEIAGEYLRKGSKVYLEGKNQTRKWQDQQGQDRYTTEVVVDSFDGKMQMLDSKPADGGQQQNQGGTGYPGQQPLPQQGQQSQQQRQAPPAQQPPQNYGQPAGGPAPGPSMDSFDDDIPF